MPPISLLSQAPIQDVRVEGLTVRAQAPLRKPHSGGKPFLFTCESGYVEPAAVSGLNVLWGEHKGEWGGVQKSGASCVRLKTDDLQDHSSVSVDTYW